MINKKELQYVSFQANNAPYPGDDYAYSVINKLSYSLYLFRKNFEGKRYNIVLSNGEEINFSIMGWNLPHLLGIDYKNITSIYMRPLLHNILEISDEYRINSLVILNRIIENADKVIANDEINNIKLLNYYRIMLKTNSFIRMTDFNNFNFGVLKFNKKIYQNITNNNILPLSTKYIISPIDEKNVSYSMMGLKDDEKFNCMIPETLIVPSNFSDYLYQQELILPLKILIIDDKKNVEKCATRIDKIKVLTFYKTLLENYNVDGYINGIKEILPERKILK